MVAQPEQVDRRVQQRFKDALAAFFRTGTWDNPETRAYELGERELDLEWEIAKAEFDRLQDEDHDYHVNERIHHPACDACAEVAELVPEPIPFVVNDGWTEAENRESWGR